MSEQTKPCPFCEHEPCVVCVGGGGCAWVECPQCRADGPEHLQGVDAAIAAWNAAPRMWPKPLTPAERALLDAAVELAGWRDLHPRRFDEVMARIEELARQEAENARPREADPPAQ